MKKENKIIIDVTFRNRGIEANNGKWRVELAKRLSKKRRKQSLELFDPKKREFGEGKSQMVRDQILEKFIFHTWMEPR